MVAGWSPSLATRLKPVAYISSQGDSVSYLRTPAYGGWRESSLAHESQVTQPPWYGIETKQELLLVVE